MNSVDPNSTFFLLWISQFHRNRKFYLFANNFFLVSIERDVFVNIQWGFMKEIWSFKSLRLIPKHTFFFNFRLTTSWWNPLFIFLLLPQWWILVIFFNCRWKTSLFIIKSIVRVSTVIHVIEWDDFTSLTCEIIKKLFFSFFPSDLNCVCCLD